MERNIIGIYGLICSGKSSFSKMLAKEMNALYIDADLIGHEALIYNKENIVKEFSDDILDNDNNCRTYSGLSVQRERGRERERERERLID